MTITLIMIAGLVLTLAAVEGQSHPCKKGMSPKGHHSGNYPKEECEQFDFAEELELTENQMETHADIKTGYRKQNIKLKSDIKLLMVDKHEAMREHDFDELKSIAKKISAKKEQIHLNRISEKEEIWNTLTKEQQAKAEELMQQRMKRHHKRSKKHCK